MLTAATILILVSSPRTVPKAARPPLLFGKTIDRIGFPSISLEQCVNPHAMNKNKKSRNKNKSPVVDKDACIESNICNTTTETVSTETIADMNEADDIEYIQIQRSEPKLENRRHLKPYDYKSHVREPKKEELFDCSSYQISLPSPYRISPTSVNKLAKANLFRKVIGKNNPRRERHSSIITLKHESKSQSYRISHHISGLKSTNR
jgi:hypothetical protein